MSNSPLNAVRELQSVLRAQTKDLREAKDDLNEVLGHLDKAFVALDRLAKRL